MLAIVSQLCVSCQLPSPVAGTKIVCGSDESLRDPSFRLVAFFIIIFPNFMGRVEPNKYNNKKACPLLRTMAFPGLNIQEICIYRCLFLLYRLEVLNLQFESCIVDGTEKVLLQKTRLKGLYAFMHFGCNIRASSPI